LNPTRVVFGAGVLARLPALANELAGPGERILLVTGRKSLRASGVLARVLDQLGPARVAVFDDVPPFPSPDVADAALAALRASGAGLVVGIGGGSALDVAKAAAILATHDGQAREFATGQGITPAKAFERPSLPFIAAPTTPGSSSEVTPFAGLWDVAAKRSLHLTGPRLFPSVALVDPDLALGMAAELAAVTGVDALTSAFESYWSKEASPISDALNLEVIRLYAGHLERSCREADRASRAGCALG